MKLLIMQSSPLHCYFVSHKSGCPSQHPLSVTLSQFSSVRAAGEVLHAQKRADKIKGRYVSVFKKTENPEGKA
jgi:hypothetical protein